MKPVYSTFLRNGKLFTRRLVITNVKHNMSNTRLYSIWKGMRYRCTNPKRPGYEYYGGKGIGVCNDWVDEHGFENFYKWAVENGYQETLTIDRKNENMDYSPENCQWIPFIDNCIKGFSKKHRPNYKFSAINEKLNLFVTFYFTADFYDQYGIDDRRISDCCTNKRVEYKGWKFFREKIGTVGRQETIPLGSTMEDEFPLEVRSIRQDDDIVHPL